MLPSELSTHDPTLAVSCRNVSVLGGGGQTSGHRHGRRRVQGGLRLTGFLIDEATDGEVDREVIGRGGVQGDDEVLIPGGDSDPW